MNSLLLRRRCAGAPRVGETKIYVTAGKYEWFSPETYRDLNHFYFITANVNSGDMVNTPYKVNFTIGRVSGITTNDPSKVTLVYNKNSYTINNWCFDVVSDIEFTLTPKIVAGKQVWDINVSFTIEPNSAFCYYGSGELPNYTGEIDLLKLQQYPGPWDNERCYFQINPNSMYVMTTDDLVTDSVVFGKIIMTQPLHTGMHTWLSDELMYEDHDEDDTNDYFFTIPSQKLTVDLPVNTCIERIYLTYNDVDFGGGIYIGTTIKPKNTNYYTVSISVSSSFESFHSTGYGYVAFKLGIDYYDSED